MLQLFPVYQTSYYTTYSFQQLRLVIIFLVNTDLYIHRNRKKFVLKMLIGATFILVY